MLQLKKRKKNPTAKTWCSQINKYFFKWTYFFCQEIPFFFLKKHHFFPIPKTWEHLWVASSFLKPLRICEYIRNKPEDRVAWQVSWLFSLESSLLSWCKRLLSPGGGVHDDFYSKSSHCTFKEAIDWPCSNTQSGSLCFFEIRPLVHY